MSNEIFDQKGLVELSQGFFVLEETMNERYEKNLALLREDLAISQMENDRWILGCSKRDIRLILTIVGMLVAGTIVLNSLSHNS